MTLFFGSQPSIRPLLALDELPIVKRDSSATETLQSPPRELNLDLLQTMNDWAAGQTEVIAQIDTSADDRNEPDLNIRWFNGRQLRPSHTMMMTVTAYSPDARSCGDSADGITASGYSVYTNGMKLVAADTKVLPFGSLISVPGYDSGNVVPVLDRGGAIKGNRLDVLFPTHEQARQFGVKKVQVTVWEFADGMPSDYVPIYKAADSVVARPTSNNAL